MTVMGRVIEAWKAYRAHHIDGPFCFECEMRGGCPEGNEALQELHDALDALLDEENQS